MYSSVSLCTRPATRRTLTGFADPLQVSIKLPLDLLLPPELEELAPVLHSLSLFGKFTVGTIWKLLMNYTMHIMLEGEEPELTLRGHPAPG